MTTPRRADDEAAPAVSARGVTKRFGAFVAVSDASVDVLRGEIHAIIGENGAGKSTLLKVAAGVHAPSSGEVLVAGRPLVPASPVEAVRRGVGMVHQHFMLVGAFRAIENMVLGAEPTDKLGRLELDGAAATATALMKRAGLEVRLDAATDDLTVGERQRLEILRVLYRGADVLLLDEPTAVLSPLEADELYATLRKLASEGRAVAVVTHRLDEVVRFADRVTVMRRGRVVLSRALRGAEPTSEAELTRAIMGGEPPPRFVPPSVPEEPRAALEIEGLTASDAHGRLVLDRFDLTVRSGEIVGIAGIEGNGQRELVQALAGLMPRATGRVRVEGEDVGPLSPRARRRLLAVVHEDRHEEGLLLAATVADNLVLGDLGDPHAGAFDERAMVERRMKRFDVRPPDPERLAVDLSGGNQQKLVVARALDRLADKGVAVLSQPTRGVDVGAAAAIHEAIGEAARAGLAVLVVSADLAELRRVCHRLVVIHRGHVVSTVSPEVPDEEIGRAMLGMEPAA